MAENNIQVVIPAQDSVEALASVLMDVFAEASGMTADENNTFWIVQDVLGVQFTVSGSSVNVYAVDYNGTTSAIINNIAYSAENCFFYNKSVEGSVFAFGITTNSNNAKLMPIAIAQDTLGVTRLIQTSSNTLNLWSPNKSKQSLSLYTNKNAQNPFVTLIKLPTVHARATFSELYQIFAMPDTTIGTDSSLYVGGGLYKIVTSGYVALAFRVA